MKSVFTLFVMLFCFLLRGQAPSALVMGHADTIPSKVLHENRALWIYNPAEGTADQDERFPVLFLLDAESHFASTVAMTRQMEGRWPGILVVGIPNTNRTRDLTPDGNPHGRAGNDSISRDDKFLDFVKLELIPYIESNYPASSYRLFSGHSLGGLTVIYTFLNDPDLFRAYIAIDPSLWWNDGQLIEQAGDELPKRTYDGISLFLGRANNMPPGMDTIAARSDTTQYTLLYRKVSGFLNVLEKTKPRGLRWKSKFYPEEIHGTVQLNAQYDALKFLFNFYQFRTSIFDLHPELDMEATLADHFKTVSERFGYPVSPPESLINNLGYTCLGIKEWEKARTFFEQNIRNHPNSANCFDSMGDYYQAVGDRQKAIEQYTKALSMGDDPGTRDKLEYLKSLQ